VTGTPIHPTTYPTVGEIADLLAQARSLSEQGHHADPQQRATFAAAKAELLARITDASTAAGIAEDRTV
jgi:hypothetical protein